MTSYRLLGQKGRTAASAPVTIGLVLAFLWALHAAAVYVPGAGFSRFPVLFMLIAGLIVWRMSSPSAPSKAANKSGITAGLWCWGAAATLSTVLNWQTDQVIATYIAVFLAGGALYAALSGLTITAADFDTAAIGLLIGSLFPILGGLLAFTAEWGIPDVETAISAWQNVPRMFGYEMATFGNRGNTAGFLLIVTPVLLAILFDARKRRALRAVCAVTLIPIVLNLIILQVRAAMLTLAAALVVVWAFKLGSKRLPLLVSAVLVAGVLLFQFQPDVGLTMTERLQAAVTVDTGGDESVQGRVDAIQEGENIAARNWLLGVGPGGAAAVHSRGSAHQFQVQQAMETGILGLLGATLLSLGVWISLARTMARGRHDEVNDLRFMLLVGPATFMTYSIIANAALNNASVNTWTVLVASMLALMPPFERRAPRVRSRARRPAAAAEAAEPSWADPLATPTR